MSVFGHHLPQRSCLSPRFSVWTLKCPPFQQRPCTQDLATHYVLLKVNTMAMFETSNLFSCPIQPLLIHYCWLFEEQAALYNFKFSSGQMLSFISFNEGSILSLVVSCLCPYSCSGGPDQLNKLNLKDVGVWEFFIWSSWHLVNYFPFFVE